MDIRPNALQTAVSGLQKAEERVGKAMADIQRATVQAQPKPNPVPAPEADRVEVSDEALVADAVRQAVVPAGDDGGDILTPLVDLLQAKIAYQANAVAVKITADVEAETVGLLKRDA